MSKLHIKTGDTVVVLSGTEKNKKGKILSVNPGKGTAIVEGVNMVTRHVKPRKMGAPGGIIKAEGAIRVCKLMRVCPKCDKATRPAHDVSGEKKVTVCKHCGEEI